MSADGSPEQKPSNLAPRFPGVDIVSRDPAWHPTPSAADYRAQAGHAQLPSDAPSARFNEFGLSGQQPSLASPHSSALSATNYPTVFPSRTPGPAFARTSISAASVLSPQQPAPGHPDWPATFPPGLEPSNLPDGEGFVHLSQPFSASSADQDAQTVSPMQTLPLPQSRPLPPRSTRKKDKARDEPQHLDELRDPAPGQKPDYPYPTLIRCAILSHGKKSPTLSEIYDMIHKRFSFFKMDDAGWKNSVRHYLSISPSFVKLPRPITEPGKGNYWTYDPNPPQKASRRPKRVKRKSSREDAYGSYEQDDRQNKLARFNSPPPQLTSDGRFTPSSSDTGDPSRSTVNRDRGIASRQKSPAHQWLEAKDTSIGLPPKPTHHENLPPPQHLLRELPRPPMHLPLGGSGQGVSLSQFATGGDDPFNVPQSPFTQGPPGTRNGSGSVGGGSGLGGNGALDFGSSSVYPRDQMQYRSSSYSSSLPSLPNIGGGDPFFPGMDRSGRSSRHGDDSQLLPSMSSNGTSYSASLRSPSIPFGSPQDIKPLRTDSAGSASQFRFDQQPLPSPTNNHWS